MPARLCFLMVVATIVIGVNVFFGYANGEKAFHKRLAKVLASSDIVTAKSILIARIDHSRRAGIYGGLVMVATPLFLWFLVRFELRRRLKWAQATSSDASPSQ